MKMMTALGLFVLLSLIGGVVLGGAGVLALLAFALIGDGDPQ